MQYTLKMHASRDLTSRFALYDGSGDLIYNRNYTLEPTLLELPESLRTQTGVLLHRLSQVIDKVLTYVSPGDNLILETSSSTVHRLLWYDGYDDRYTKFLRERVLPKVNLSPASIEVSLNKKLKASNFPQTRLATESLDVPIGEALSLL